MDNSAACPSDKNGTHAHVRELELVSHHPAELRPAAWPKMQMSDTQTQSVVRWCPIALGWSAWAGRTRQKALEWPSRPGQDQHQPAAGPALPRKHVDALRALRISGLVVQQRVRCAANTCCLSFLFPPPPPPPPLPACPMDQPLGAVWPAS